MLCVRILYEGVGLPPWWATYCPLTLHHPWPWQQPLKGCFRSFLCCCLVAKSYLTLCDPMNCSPLSSSVHWISQARILEWVAVSFSRGSSWPRDWTSVSCIAGRFFTAEWPGKHPLAHSCCCCCCQAASVVSESVWPHRRQHIRLPRPWDSPGKNTGMGCHFLLQCMKVKSESEVAQPCPTLSNPTDCSPPGSSVHGIFRARALEYWAVNKWSQRG